VFPSMFAVGSLNERAASVNDAVGIKFT
jgi:hypothetical protein